MAETKEAKTEKKEIKAATKGSPAESTREGEREIKKETVEKAKPKTVEKKETKTEKNTEKKEETKAIKEKKEAPKPKKEKKSRKIIIKKTEKTIEQRAIVQRKKSLPTYRGRFGKRSVRKKSKDKWNKWRFPRGIDVSHVMSDGYNPKEGFRTPRIIRDVHPSGYNEVTVKTIKDLELVKDNYAIRVLAGIGRQKKLAIVDKAIEKGIKVLNP